MACSEVLSRLATEAQTALAVARSAKASVVEAQRREQETLALVEQGRAQRLEQRCELEKTKRDLSNLCKQRPAAAAAVASAAVAATKAKNKAHREFVALGKQTADVSLQQSAKPLEDMEEHASTEDLDAALRRSLCRSSAM